MTAETLKPFITPQNVDFTATHSTTTRRQRSSNTLAVGLGVTATILALALLGITIWHTLEINKIKSNVKSVENKLESLQKRLGINYLDEFNDFEKQYNNALIDDPNALIDDDDDEDADLDADDNDDILSEHKVTSRINIDDIDYDDLVEKLNTYEDDDDDDEDEEDEDEEINSSDGDDFYMDYEKYKDSKKKKESTRATRSIGALSNEIDETTENQQKSEESTKLELTPELVEDVTKPEQQLEPKKSYRTHQRSFEHFVSESNHKPRLLDVAVQHKPRTYRRRKFGAVRKAKSLRHVNAKRYASAAHFHLNRKVPDRYAAINVDSYSGDMYIGHPSWSNEISSEQFFTVENGVLTVHEPGLYYIYAQVCYNNTHDQNGFVIFHGHKPFLQCLNTVPTNVPTKIHTCHTSGLINLKESETIHLRDFHSDRSVILKDTNNRSYFGLIKMS